MLNMNELRNDNKRNDDMSVTSIQDSNDESKQVQTEDLCEREIIV